MSHKYAIDQMIFWVEASTRYCHKISCTMCFGKRTVTLILGDGSHLPTECGFCSQGVDYATGVATAWSPEARVHCGLVTGISKAQGTWKYQIGYATIEEGDAFGTEPEANAHREIRFKEVTERAEKYFIDNFKTATKKQIWSAGYHKNCIKDAERSIEWHKKRLGMIEAQP